MLQPLYYTTPRHNTKLNVLYLNVTKTIANIRYFPSNGKDTLVGGIISVTSKKNTVRLTRIEMDRFT